jgi:hypothetical protein
MIISRIFPTEIKLNIGILWRLIIDDESVFFTAFIIDLLMTIKMVSRVG